MNKREILLATYQQWLTSILIIIISILSTYLVAKYLNIFEFAKYSEAIALGSIFLILFDSGFKNIIFRENIVKLKQQKYLKEAGVNSTLILVFSLIIITLLKQDYYMHLALICFYLTNLLIFKSFYFKGIGKYLYDFKLNISFRGLSLIFLIIQLIVLEKLSAFSFFLFWCLSLLICVLIIYLKNLNLKLKSLKFNFKIYKKIYCFFLIDLFVVIYFKSDILILKYFDINPVIIANYSMSHKMFEIPMMFITPLCIVFYRNTRIQFLEKRLKFNSVYKVIYAIILSIVYFLLIKFFYKDFIKLLFSEKFVESIAMVEKMNIAILFMSVNCFFIMFFFSINKEKIILFIVFLSMVFNLSFNMLLVPILGHDAVIYSFIITEILVFSLLIINLFVRRNIYESSF